MDDLKNAMQIIDRHSDKLPDGDYLTLCNIMRDLYTNKSGNINGHRSVFTGVYIEQEDFDHNATGYFQTIFEERIRDIEIRLKTAEMMCVNEIVRELRPMQRLTSNIKLSMIHHFSNINQITLPANTEECFNAYVGDAATLAHLCRTYMHIENQFREIMIADLNNRYRELQCEVDLITEEGL
jgi:hypothetical protein